MLREEIQLQTVELVRIAAEPSGIVLDPGELFWRRIVDWLPFTVLVIVPTLLAAFYCFGLATDRYQSEVTYVVRTPGTATGAEIANIVQGTGVMRSGDDAYIAKEFMLSRGAMELLIEKDGLLDMFAQAGRDILWHSTYVGTPTREQLLKHYLNFITVADDHTTGISKLSVQAFAPEDAQRLATALVDHTETFLNGLNNRAQQDAIAAALRDVEAAKATAYTALDAVTVFRNAEETVDPTKASAGIVASITALSMEMASSNARLADLMTTTPQSPEIPTIRSRIAALDKQVGEQRQQLGGDSSSLAPRIERYERLLLDQQFAEKAFISALTSLESARLDATRQRIFVEKISDAELPDQPAGPHRVLSVFITFMVGLMIWWIAHIIGKDSREHGRR